MGIIKGIILATILIIGVAVILVAVIFGLQYLMTLVPCIAVAYVSTIMLLMAVLAIVVILLIIKEPK